MNQPYGATIAGRRYSNRPVFGADPFASEVQGMPGGYSYRLSPQARTITIIDGPQNVGKTYSVDDAVGGAILAEIRSVRVAFYAKIAAGAAIAFALGIAMLSTDDKRKPAARHSRRSR